MFLRDTIITLKKRADKIAKKMGEVVPQYYIHPQYPVHSTLGTWSFFFWKLFFPKILFCNNRSKHPCFSFSFYSRNLETGGHRVGNERLHGVAQTARGGAEGRQTGSTVVRRSATAAQLAPADRSRCAQDGRNRTLRSQVSISNFTKPFFFFFYFYYFPVSSKRISRLDRKNLLIEGVFFSQRMYLVLEFRRRTRVPKNRYDQMRSEHGVHVRAVPHTQTRP